MRDKKNTKTIIVVAGPTAVGKTSLSIKLAKEFKTEIISADSRQCYKELSIGVARPSVEELNEVKHHFIASHSIASSNKEDMVDAAAYEKYALQIAADLFEKNDYVILTGGTGLYIKAFCEGMDEIPEVGEGVRERIIKMYKEEGIEWLQKEIQQKDPAYYAVGEIQNPQRLMRALEVIESTGKSIIEFRKGEKAERDFNIIKIGLEIPKEELHERINIRVDQMMEEGLLEEVKSVLPYSSANALQTVGYKELFTYMNGEIGLDEAVDLIKRNTRKYAKRQMTWFKKDKGFAWFSPNDFKEILQYIVVHQR
jgi:tRNA dimethylallyltransferase